MFSVSRVPRLLPGIRAFSMVRRVAPKKATPAPSAPKSPEPEISAPVANVIPDELPQQPLTGVTERLSFHDAPLPEEAVAEGINWSDSYHGLGHAPFPKDVCDVLLAPLTNEDIEIKPDGLLYLPEIKYRRILNRAFGPGGWGLAPRSETFITLKQVSREYALICQGRLVSVARGEQDYFGTEEKLTTALEGCKSNALMRCCKDLGIASELWDPVFIRKWKKKYCDEMFAEHVVNKRKKKLWKLKVNEFEYPYRAC